MAGDASRLEFVEDRNQYGFACRIRVKCWLDDVGTGFGDTAEDARSMALDETVQWRDDIEAFLRANGRV